MKVYPVIIYHDLMCQRLLTCQKRLQKGLLGMGVKHDYGMFNSRNKPYAADYYVDMMLV